MGSSTGPGHLAPPSSAGVRRKWRFPVLAVIAGLAAWLGMVTVLYPTVASWFSQYDQSQLIGAYTTEATSSGLSPSASQQLKEAHAYNDALTSGALLEAHERLPTGAGTTTDKSLDYDSLLRVDSTGMMARLKIPSINLDLPVYHGTSDETLARGVGHLEGTSLPVGGAGTHAVLTGHRGLATATLFTNLNRVGIGDTFTIEVLDQVLTYKVFRTQVVDPDQTASLRPVAGRDLVTLVTCTPLGINSQRILVTGERVFPTPAKDLAAAAKAPDIPGFPWWIVILVGGTALIGVYIWRSGLPPKKKSFGGRGQVAAGAASAGGGVERGDAARYGAGGVEQGDAVGGQGVAGPVDDSSEVLRPSAVQAEGRVAVGSHES